MSVTPELIAQRVAGSDVIMEDNKAFGKNGV